VRAAALGAALLLAGAAGCGGDEPRPPNVIVEGPASGPAADGGATAASATGAGERPPGAEEGGGTAPGAGQGDGPAETTPTAAPRRPPARQLRGGRVLFPFAGTSAPEGLLKRLRRGEAAGVILLGRNIGSPQQVRALTRSLRRAAREGGRPPPLITIDQEGGTVKRLPGAPRRSPPQLAAQDSAAAARAEGRATARTLRAAGVNVDFAPVADVVRRGSALERERRGFGSDPNRVVRLAGAFAAGLRDGGVAATTKHFPGFGAARGNTDDAPQRIGLSAAALRRTDMEVFARLRAVPLVMLSSAVYPALDERPAVLSRRIVTGELRDRIGFRGVTVTDDLETPALAGRDAPVQAARAGADLLLFARTYRAAARAAERVPADRDAHARIDALRRALR
jgi:beta-N-acetylhexosaminidase